jgi:hypothetical protein
VEELGAVVGLAVDEAVGVFYGAGGVEVISSPSWICDDDVRWDEGGEEGEEGDCAEWWWWGRKHCGVEVADALVVSDHCGSGTKSDRAESRSERRFSVQSVEFEYVLLIEVVEEVVKEVVKGELGFSCWQS